MLATMSNSSLYLCISDAVGSVRPGLGFVKGSYKSCSESRRSCKRGRSDESLDIATTIGVVVRRLVSTDSQGQLWRAEWTVWRYHQLRKVMDGKRYWN